jgi:uncharacterized protein
MKMWSWDETKREETLRDRQLDFADLVRFQIETALVRLDTRHDYGEPRYRMLGMLDGQLHVVIATPRGEGLRAISLRRANPRERREWPAKP